MLLVRDLDFYCQSNETWLFTVKKTLSMVVTRFFRSLIRALEFMKGVDLHDLPRLGFDKRSESIRCGSLLLGIAGALV